MIAVDPKVLSSVYQPGDEVEAAANSRFDELYGDVALSPLMRQIVRDAFVTGFISGSTHVCKRLNLAIGARP